MKNNRKVCPGQFLKTGKKSLEIILVETQQGASLSTVTPLPPSPPLSASSRNRFEHILNLDNPFTDHTLHHFGILSIFSVGN